MELYRQGDHKVMVTARNFHAVSWSWRRGQSGVCYFSRPVRGISSCDTHRSVSLRILIHRDRARDYEIIGEHAKKDVRRLRLSGSIHAWINNAWRYNAPRRDNYGARRKSDNQGRRENGSGESRGVGEYGIICLGVHGSADLNIFRDFSRLGRGWEKFSIRVELRATLGFLLSKTVLEITQNLE